jgi:4-amino-4-deoxy-L-arabinose transferase-like glycosyltransferase
MQSKQSNKILLIILFLHFLGILMLSSSYSPLKTDMIENLLWGRNLNFVNEKHPPFFGWESYLTVKLFGYNLFFYHILTPIHQTILFYFTFLLAKRILNSNIKALITVVLSQGILFHTFYYVFNANTANYGFFTAIYYFLYIALKDKNYKLFIPISILSAIVIMIKYSAVLLFTTIAITILATQEGRKALKSSFLYFGIFLFFVILSPYLLHLLGSEFGGDGFKYLYKQSLQNKMRWFEIPRFLLGPLIFSSPMLIAFFKIKKSFIKNSLNFNAAFLLINAIMPFLVTFIILIFMKAQIEFYWLSMFYSLIPICLLYFWEIKDDAFKVSAKIIYPIILVIWFLYILIQLIVPKENIKEIAQFTQDVTKNNIDNFICNDSKKNCGFILIYGAKFDNKINYQPIKYYSKLDMNKALIIGEIDELDLSNYNTKSFTKTILQYYPIKSFQVLEKKLNIKRKSSTIKLTIITKKSLS